MPVVVESECKSLDRNNRLGNTLEGQLTRRRPVNSRKWVNGRRLAYERGLLFKCVWGLAVVEWLGRRVDRLIDMH